MKTIADERLNWAAEISFAYH